MNCPMFLFVHSSSSLLQDHIPKLEVVDAYSTTGVEHLASGILCQLLREPTEN
jgi:predicted dinucleotide-binding enzyme